MKDWGTLYVIAAPSGTGKTTLVKALIDVLPRITVSISHTTRPHRPNERHGKNYHFVDKDEFERMIQHGDFLEYATIFGHYYGTSKSWVHKTLSEGTDVILEIDWQGHQQVKHLFPEAISIFILPPSLNDLRERLVKRNQDHPEIIQVRLADAKTTLSHINDFDYVVMNEDFDRALHDLKIIIQAGHFLRKRQVEKYVKLLEDFISLS